MADDYLGDFVSEGREQITELNNALLTLEDDPSNEEAMESIFRTAHTLKGNFAAMGFQDASGLAHAVEDLLDQIRQGEMEVTEGIMDHVFSGIDELEIMLNEIAEAGEAEHDPGATIDEIRGVLEDGGIEGGEEEEEEGAEEGDGEVEGGAGRVGEAFEEVGGPSAFEEVDDNLFYVKVGMGESQMKGVDSMFLLESLEDDGLELVASVPEEETITDGDYEEGFELFLASDLGEADVEEIFDTSAKADSAEVVDVTERIEEGEEVPEEEEKEEEEAEIEEKKEEEEEETGKSKKKKPKSASADKIQSVRVNVDQLDTLLNRVEELVTTRIKLRQAVMDRDFQTSEEELNELDKIASGLQDTVMDMRLVPLKKVVGKFPRLVRDLARSEEKEVDLVIEGEDIELDRTVLNEIGDPLMHLLRNAVDHGVEPPEEREGKGKPRTGTVRLEARRERDKVTITVSDDGAGIDPEAVKEKAIDKGVITRDEAERLEDKEAYELIFSSGFSTASEVTDVSGRGVGMDVVKTTIKNLDGSLDVDSEIDEGTEIKLTLPVTVAIVKVLLVNSGEEKYGIPLKYVEEISRAGGYKTVEGEQVITHNDKVYPVIHLGEALNVPNAMTNGGGMLVRISEDLRRVAIQCDSVIGQEEVVVKPFEGILSGIPGVSGAAILGQGDVVTILDIETL